MASDKDVAIRKRQQIDSSKKTMFMFVAGAAFVAGVSLVVAFFLVQQIIFHSKVWGEKQQTISTLDKNIVAIDELKSKVRVLETSSALNSVKISDDSNALQSVLDALPDNANADALGASLQNKFVGSVDGLTLENLVVDSPDEEGAEAEASEPTYDGSAITFTMSVGGSADKLKELLTKFAKSIRVIDIVSAEIQAGDDNIVINRQGRAYFEPAQVIELQSKVVKP